MVVHQCPKCSKIFNKKSNLTKHLNKKIHCDGINDSNLKCKHCGKQFCRKDSLNRHIGTIHANIINQAKQVNVVNGNYNNVQPITVDKIIYKGDVTINNNNNYFVLCPFSKEEIDKLTTDDKICIFSSDENPIIMIVFKTNLNPNATEYHNVGYPDLNKGYGYIFNGKTWIKKEIQSIINEMLNSKQKDLIKIHNEIKDFLPEEENKLIENKLIEIRNCVEPRLENHVRSKKRLVTNLKTQLCNNRHLLHESIKRSGKPIIGIEMNNKRRNILGNMTTEELDRLLKLKKINEQKLDLKKELAKDLLHQIDEIQGNNYDSLMNLIDQTNDINNINIITRLLNKTFCFGNEINNEIVKKQIENEIEINRILFN